MTELVPGLLTPGDEFRERLYEIPLFNFGNSWIEICSDGVGLRDRRKHNWERNLPFLLHCHAVVEKKLQSECGAEAHM